MMNKIQAYSIVGSFKGKVSLFAKNLDKGALRYVF